MQLRDLGERYKFMQRGRAKLAATRHVLSALNTQKCVCDRVLSVRTTAYRKRTSAVHELDKNLQRQI